MSKVCVTALAPKKSRPSLPREFFARIYGDHPTPDAKNNNNNNNEEEEDEEVDVTCDSSDDEKSNERSKLLLQAKSNNNELGFVPRLFLQPPHWDSLQLARLHGLGGTSRVQQHLHELSAAFCKCILFCLIFKLGTHLYSSLSFLFFQIINLDAIIKILGYSLF